MASAAMKLFHYTNINNLALILKTKSIRFGRLDKVNDPTEGVVMDFAPVSQYIFISCWTANEEENLALWNMYTPEMRGVRIELELPIFNSYRINDTDDYLFSEEEYINEDKGYFFLGGKNKPYKIEYTDDEDLLKPKIRTDIGLHLASVAKHKRTIWKIEQEHRFRLEILPIDKKVQSKDFRDRYEHLIERQVPPPINGYLVKIATETFQSMKIGCSPKLRNGDKEIIEALIKGYNETAILSESNLTGLIR